MNKRSANRRLKRKTGIGKQAQKKVIHLSLPNDLNQVAWFIKPSETNVYVGPSVEGGDKEYIKVVSGKVNERRPSFA